MKRRWVPEELAEHWILLSDELTLVGNKTGATRLGFAILLKAFQLEGLFPHHKSDIPLDRATRKWFLRKFRGSRNEMDLFTRHVHCLERNTPSGTQPGCNNHRQFITRLHLNVSTSRALFSLCPRRGE